MNTRYHCYIVASDGKGNVRPSRVTRRDAKEISATPYNTFEEAQKAIDSTKVCIGCSHELPFYYFNNGSDCCYIC